MRLHTALGLMAALGMPGGSEFLDDRPPAPPRPPPPPRRHRSPANVKFSACVLCFGAVFASEPGAHVQEHHDPRGAAVRLLWHRDCTERCEWLQRLADNEGPGVPEDEAAETFEALHAELHARLMAEGGPSLLRAVIHVARDLPPPYTLRSPGPRWGLPTRREVAR